jgi:uncharacterized membrane protein
VTDGEDVLSADAGADAGRGYAARAADRLTAFSDAVVAIAITLLALDLPIPAGATVAAFRNSFWHNSPAYIAFLVSFAVIASSWGQHHDIFRYDRGTDGRMRMYHLAWLLMIILFPFATRLLTARDNADLTVHAIQWGTYSLVEALSSLLLVLMVRHLITHDELEPDTPRRVVSHQVRQSWGTMLGFGLSIPVFFVTENAWVLWIVIPIVVGRAWRILARRSQRHDGAGPATAGLGTPGGGS